jgi:5-methylcytosine-specific restriction enzyme A
LEIVMKIGASEIQASYSVAKSVYDGGLTKEAGAKQLRDQQSMNLDSARDYIKSFRCLMDGLLFTRTISAPAADYYFSQMLSDYGPSRLAVALDAMREHIEYYEGASKAKVHALREVVSKYQAQLGDRDLEAYRIAFEAGVAKALKDSPEERASRLKVAPEIPKRITVPTQYFLRNRDVVAEVLLRAAGVCEKCKSPAPFIRRADKTPYLEVHHRKQLAAGGTDTVANAIAVCPNCHRRAHYGLEDA